MISRVYNFVVDRPQFGPQGYRSAWGGQIGGAGVGDVGSALQMTA